MNDHKALLAEALFELRELRSELDEIERARTQPIAIIGMGCRFPGAKDTDSFWRLLCDARDAIIEVPSSRWDPNEFYDLGPKTKTGKRAGAWGGFLENLEWFDATFFGISPKEAPHVDPRQRLMLEIAWEALEDAGIPPETLAGSSTGVYIAVLNNDYDKLMCRDYGLFDSYTGTGTANTIIANRLSYFFDLKGPSLTLDTACSGSLLAIELACRSLRTGECALALAGGVSVNLLPSGDLFFSAASALSPSGRCRTFDANADGIVRSEGAAIVVLKPLSTALAEGDPIYAVIKGGAVNSDGRSNGIMAPNGLAQRALLVDVYQQAGISPAEVQYVEAHGTGTPLGDSIEVKALASVLTKGRDPSMPCVLGSAKSNIGHTESAAGVAGVIKVALAMKNRLIPPTLHVDEISPLVKDAEFPIRIYTEPGPWPRDSERLVAGVSGFGFGGTNVHLVLEEAPSGSEVPAADGRRDHILTVSGRTPEALQANASVFARSLAALPTDLSPVDICHTVNVRRSHHEHRLALIARTREEFIEQLEQFAGGEIVPPNPAARSGSLANMKPAFVFSGQGTQWPGMGRELFETELVFRDSMLECDRLLRDHVDWSLLRELDRNNGHSNLNSTDVVQPAIFAIQVSLAALWRSWGIEPGVVIGQSLGEVAAAHVSGALSLQDAVRIVFFRGKLMKRVAGRGKTAVAALNMEHAHEALIGFDGRLAIAGNTGPASCVISGDSDALDSVLESLRSRGVFCRVLENVDVAFHSRHMDAIRSEFEEAISRISPRPSSVPFISAVAGDEVGGESLGAGYWGRNLRDPFSFAGAVEGAVRSGVRCFLEISPHPVLIGAIKQTLNNSNQVGAAFGSVTNNGQERMSMLTTLARLYMAGHSVDWKSLYPSGKFIKLPHYQWQRERYWRDQLKNGRKTERESGERGLKESSWPCADLGEQNPHSHNRHPFLVDSNLGSLATRQQVWEMRLNAETLGYLKDHSVGEAIVFPGAAYVELALAAAKERFEAAAWELNRIEFQQPMILRWRKSLRVQLILSQASAWDAQFHVYSMPEEADVRSDRWTMHASGTLALSKPDGESTSPKPVSIAEQAALCVQEIAPEDYYNEFEQRHLRYGPSFRTVQQIFRGQGVAMGRIELPEHLRSDATSYRIHPVLLDGAFQMVAAAMPGDEAGLYLPNGIGRIRIHGRVGDRASVVVRLSSASAQPGGRSGGIIAEIQLIGDDGAVQADISGLSLQKLDESRFNRQDDLLNHVYDVQWVEQLHEASSKAGRCRWLIFAPATGLGPRVAELLESLGHQCTLVSPGEQRQMTVGQHGIQIDPSNQKEFDDVFDDFLAKRSPLPIRVVHLWLADNSLSDSWTTDELSATQSLGSESLIRIVRAISSSLSSSISAAAAKPALRLWVVTRGAQTVADKAAPVRIAQAPIWGTARVLALEHPEIWGGLVDLDTGDDERQAQLLVDEMLALDEGVQTAYRGERRYVPRLDRRIEIASRRPYEFRTDCAYLITGGLSGLGLETARWMASRGARRLILLGRSQIPDRGAWSDLSPGSDDAERPQAIMELERMGASVIAESIDVANEGEMIRFFDRYRREGHPPIGGLVHSAGLINDQMAMTMGIDLFRQVVKPKLAGSWLLHKLTRNLQLDFFVMFSSVTSVLGRIGQANYAAGNAFMDALAHYRRAIGLPAVSINWGPWSKVGMYARSEEAASSDAEKTGQIGPQEGVEILSLLLQSDSPQVMVMRADWTKMKSTPVIAALCSERDQVHSSTTRPSLAAEILLADELDRRTIILKFLEQEVAAVLGCAPSRVSHTAPLTSMGIDSIMAVELRNKVQADLGVDLSLIDLFTGSVDALIKSVEDQLRSNERLSAVLAEIENMSPDEVDARLAHEN